jgi:hypothetical protein
LLLQEQSKTTKTKMLSSYIYNTKLRKQ